MSNSLRSKLIRLAHARPELRPALLPLVKSAADKSADFASRSRAADPSRLASSKEAATVNPQPFGRAEWNTYSGATSFADGSDPIFAAATLEAIIVADAKGIELTLMGNDSTTDTVYHMNARFSSQKDAIRAAQSALRLIRTGSIPPGFKPL